MFDKETQQLFYQTGNMHDLDPAALAAIAQVESGGITTTPVNGRNEPLIRFEGHYFDKRLSPSQRAQARAQGLSAPKAGAIPNPASQAARWRMLNSAARINRDAAYESTSWGVGQVMGAHWHWLGYSSVEEMVTDVRNSVAQQIDLMARFIVYSNLRTALNTHDWRKLAYNYNGPLYAKNKYDLKLAKAYALYQPQFPSSSPSPAPLA